jgi:hypothetical protein
MTLTIRSASWLEDELQIKQILKRNIPGPQEGGFEWRHHANPAGPGWSFLACDGNGAIAAMASVFPRNMWVDGQPMVCGQVGEFVVDAAHRSLGPAVLLQRATFRPVDAGEVAFCYDCPPHDQGMSTFKRLGMPANAEVIRYALPLKADEFLAKKMGNGIWTKPAAAAANLLLGVRRFRSPDRGIEIREFQDCFGEEFTELDHAVPSFGLIRASRSAQDLNWRYRKNPPWESRVLVARRAGRLLGFLTFVLFDGKASIVDIFGLPLSETAIPLLNAAIKLCSAEGRDSIYAYCSDASELGSFFQKAGFSRRERAARVVAYAKANDPIGPRLVSGLRWSFSQAEIML